MHIPNDVLAPQVYAVTGIIGAAGFLTGLRQLEDRLRDRTTVLMGTMSAFVFSAQMINFPLYPLPISGHLLGGVLAAVLLGPWAGAVVIGIVLVVQCLLGDGGLTALGANFINMGLIGSVVGYAIYNPIRRRIGGRAGVLIGAMAAAWFSVILASGAFAVELAASGRRADFFMILGCMVLVHSVIGLGEAIITGLVLRFVLLVRPDLIYDPKTEPETRTTRWGQVAVAGLAIALVVAIFVAPFASEHPDGLEAVGAWFGFLKQGQPMFAPLLGVGTALAGLVGTLTVFGVGLGLARIFSRPAPEGIGPNAA